MVNTSRTCVKWQLFSPGCSSSRRHERYRHRCSRRGQSLQGWPWGRPRGSSPQGWRKFRLKRTRHWRSRRLTTSGPRRRRKRPACQPLNEAKFSTIGLKNQAPNCKALKVALNKGTRHLQQLQ